MKKIFVFAVLLAVLVTACGGSAPAATEAPAVAAPATAAPAATAVPATEAPAEAPAYFTENFSGGLDNWYQSLLSGEGDAKPDKLTVTPGGSGLNVNLDAKLMYLYYFYTPHTYDDVSLKMKVTNKGDSNSFQTLLVCRATDAGWYEFAMQNDGLWFLYAFKDGNYNQIGNGGATNIKTGKETNEIGMDCVGDQISLFVNGQELTGSPVKDTTFAEGQIGFSVASLQIFPVNVDVNSIVIGEK
jgi:hypothetical protein